MRLVLAGHTIDALSVGGIETCFQVPSLGVNLDIGRCPRGAEKQGTLLLTHGHIDHAAGFPYYVSMRGMVRAPPPRVYVPAESHPTFVKMVQVWGELQSDAERCQLIPVTPGDVFPLRSDVVVRAFRSPHRIACVGYTLCRRVRKLKAEYAGMPGARIAEIARTGVAVQEEVDRFEICFPGDTRIEVVEREEMVRTSRLLMLECTFMGSSVSPEKARAGGHVHLDDIAERADLFQNEAILLTHFSRRHRPQEIRDAVERRFPPHLRERIHLLFERPDRRPLRDSRLTRKPEDGTRARRER